MMAAMIATVAVLSPAMDHSRDGGQ
jgi:hypothetical protein